MLLGVSMMVSPDLFNRKGESHSDRLFHEVKSLTEAKEESPLSTSVHVSLLLDCGYDVTHCLASLPP